MSGSPIIGADNIFVGLGANLAHARWGAPIATLALALQHLQLLYPVRVLKQSGWFHSAPVPLSRQHWFTNGMVELETKLQPDSLLAALHRIEADLGRHRTAPNAPRVIDLDLIDYRGEIVAARGEGGLVLPHPRAAERRFVLYPLRDIAPRWRHPVSGLDIAVLIARLAPEQHVCRLDTGRARTP